MLSQLPLPAYSSLPISTSPLSSTSLPGGHHFPLLSDLRYRQHSTNPLPTNLMACSLARKCASLNSPTHLKYFSLFLPLPKCHQFSNTRGQSLQPSSPATFALHELILVRLPAVPNAFAGYLQSLSYFLELLFNLSHIWVLTMSNLDY